MKNYTFYTLIFLMVFTPFLIRSQSVSDKLTTIPQNQLKLKGHVGKQTDLLIEKRVLAQDYDYLVEPFRHKNETHVWQMEFWGKWMLGAVAAWEYTHDEQLMKHMSESVTSMIETQLSNGYIGNYSPEYELKSWDIWGRKYVLLGLLRYHDITKNKKALKAAIKSADYLLSQVGPGKVNIVETGNYIGMASSSILEPMMMLYNKTNKQKYLDFSKYIVAQWETPKGPQLISKALAGVHVADRFPQPEKWFGPWNGQKAYEMMSCYNGLLELYKVTGTPDYLKAVEMTMQDIVDEEINIAGSGTSFEGWYHGKEKQTAPTFHTMETCVMTTWMKVNYDLLRLTGKLKYADNIELTYYNALMASTQFGGEKISKYSPLQGSRGDDDRQCDMDINCCSANGPRGYMMLPRFAIMTSDNEVYVNLYSELSARFTLSSKNEISLEQKTSYPETDKIQFTINPDKSEAFTIALRIPAWSTQNSLMVNGKKIDKVITPGTYVKITRKWKKGDQISLQLDLRGRLVKQNGFVAIKRGPIVLTRYSMYEDGFVDESVMIENTNNIVDLQISETKPEGVWLSFTAKVKVGTGIPATESPLANIHFCDFGSAGNIWDVKTRYKVWLPETINVLKYEYKEY
ncbi:MAG: glycoside hydrolase family 127 protein [Flavobacteriaceae bacterium]|nr:glycoside hydrolase family 127 protein [Flavobacteriaceae bacterium]